MHRATLCQNIKSWMDEIQQADILVGIPSCNSARTIPHVVRAVQAGLAKYFPAMKAVLINSDCGSTDGTLEVVRDTTIKDFNSILINYSGEPLSKLATPYNGISGKGSALRTIFEIAVALNVKACAVVDADLRSITPEWIELLVKPVLSGEFDYVAPLYYRHKYDGTITNSIIYPLTRSLYGKRVRQPIGGEFGLSGELARFFLSKDVWESDVARYGIDIWMTTTAIANDYRICQSLLGAKIHDPKDPGSDLSAMLCQVVGTAFDLMDVYSSAWRDIKGSESVPTFGFQYTVGLEPVKVDVERMIRQFSIGVTELMEKWKGFLPEEVISFLLTARSLALDEFHIPDEIWVEIIYSFAGAARRKAAPKEKGHLLRSLAPLYLGKTASFVLDTRESGAGEVEKKIERLCGVYEDRKAFLLDIWESPAPEERRQRMSAGTACLAMESA